LLYRLRDFTYDAYVELMSMLKKKYRVIPFCEVTKTKVPLLILRHDIDASLKAALRMAEIERKLEIRSTYFVLFSHKLYNLLERDSLNTLRRISSLGHEIGLHYDVQTYEAYGQAPEESLKNEVQMLEHLLKRKIFSIACHNVSLMTGKDPLGNVAGYINAYDPRFCRKYVSDSCRAWVLKDLTQFLRERANSRFGRAQLLIHPFLWSEDVCERSFVLTKLFEDVAARNREYEKEWQRIWREHAKVKVYEQTTKAKMRRGVARAHSEE
jgi:hypothetical protein